MGDEVNEESEFLFSQLQVRHQLLLLDWMNIFDGLQRVC